ncbi:hypothetical protein [Inquilinus sp.]|jgi:hypothetical protein|uniref:hypothetical protein n=1 Tax=Inquilinus sp. TaxID=1932117 RepID=UPI003784EA98
MDVQIRTRLLAAALADHDGLAAALTAAKEAEAWLQCGQAPITIDWDRGEALMLAAPAASPFDEPETPVDAAPIDPAAKAPAAELVRENGHNTHSAASAEPPQAKAPPTSFRPRSRSGAPEWLAATVAAARKVQAAGELIQPSTMSRELEIASAAAGWRLAEMVKAGLATATGRSNQRRYELIDTIPGIGNGPVVPVEEAVLAPEPVPAPEPASPEPETAEAAPAASGPDPADIGEAPAAAAPEPQIDLPSAPVVVVPTQDRPATPGDAGPAPTVPPPPAAPRPRPPVLMNVRSARPVPPPPAIRPAAPMQTTMDDVVAFLRGRGLQVSNGPRGFVYQGLQMSAPELLKTANMIREGLRKPLLSVAGIMSR